MNAVVTAKSVLMLGIAGWMTIAVLNNATDPGTNRFHLGMMFEMALLSEEPNGLGQNLRWRALPAAITATVLWVVVAVQAAVTAYLWKAAWACAAAALRSPDPLPDAARKTAVRALTCFMALWLCFMIGGFWFGYWIKQGAIQQVHMTLLILSVLSIGFIGNRQLEGDSVTGHGRVSD
ncbi:DUF2165 family protein [Brucella anthropi]|uniref:DUF2165 domain-containing protein n=1 Tax=Brucella anthropi TaxID=529 RepID=A0A6L3YYE0_BRUAN|nr:DUF2165 family protein [Brucella anthropi]KAB2758405.1 DUF2165 domain-containing protein [Brucella anthropi]